MIADAVVAGTPGAGVGFDVAVGRGRAERAGVGDSRTGPAGESTVDGRAVVVEIAAS